MMESPDEIRAAARNAIYPNSEAERQNIRRVDDEVFAPVRVLEDHIASHAETFIDEARTDLIAAAEAIDTLQKDIVDPLRDQTATVGDTAQRYETLRRTTERIIAELERSASEADWQAARAQDVYGTYSNLVAKFPVLRKRVAI